jgi:hypothetical protein
MAEPVEDPTIESQNDDNPEDEEEDNDNANNPGKDADNEPPARALTAAERDQNEMISMLVHVLGFSQGATTALYEDQGIQTLEHLQELTNSLVN